MNIAWIGANAVNYRAGRAGGFNPEAIVIHIMDGSLTGTDAWFNDPKALVTAHYGVGKDGTLHQYVKETDTAFHAGVVDRPSWPLIKPGVNPNLYTIGVEHEGLGSEPYPWPDAQLQASLGLVAAIAQRWNIPCDEDHIIPHHWIRTSKTCPGDNFDQGDYVGRLAAPAAPGAPVGAAVLQSVRVIVGANVRTQPTTASQVVRVVAAGDTFDVTAVDTAGEQVSGNAVWFHDGAGTYLWAGATDRPSGL